MSAARRFVATFDYIETVHGEPRTFTHETIIEARTEDEAQSRALLYFGRLEMETGVGWLRQLQSCKVTAASPGAVARGGRRIDKDADLEPRDA